MNLKEIEKAIYNNEEMMFYMEILKKDNWNKAKPSKRFEFFKKLHEVVASSCEDVPSKFGATDFTELDLKQDVVVGEKGVVINKKCFSRQHNPYKIIYCYIFELFLIDNIRKAEEEDAADNKEKRKLFINNACSIFDNWDNYYDRKSKEFLYQPLTSESNKISLEFVYNLLKYMHKNYGMDDYIGKELADMMVDGFRKEKVQERVEKNYKKMEEKYKLYDEEIEKQDSLFKFLDDHPNFEGLEDNDFFFLLNTKLVEAYSIEFRAALYKEFVRRILKNEEKVNEFNASFTLGIIDDEDLAVVFGEDVIPTNIYNELNLIFIKLLYYKISNGILDEIKDDDFKLEAMECLEYMEELKDEDGEITCRYLGNAFAYVECKNYLLNYWYDLIEQSIKNNKIFNYGKPLLPSANFSKFDAYLKFAFDKDYEEVRKEQFSSLKEEYFEKKGASK